MCTKKSEEDTARNDARTASKQDGKRLSKHCASATHKPTSYPQASRGQNRTKRKTASRDDLSDHAASGRKGVLAGEKDRAVQRKEVISSMPGPGRKVRRGSRCSGSAWCVKTNVHSMTVRRLRGEKRSLSAGLLYALLRSRQRASESAATATAESKSGEKIKPGRGTYRQKRQPCQAVT